RPAQGRVHLGHLGQQLPVVFAVPGLVEVELLVKLVLLNERQDSDSPTQERLAVLASNRRRRQMPVLFLELVEGGAELPQSSKDLFRVALGFAGRRGSSRWRIGRVVGILTADREKTGHQQASWQIFHEGFLSVSAAKR